ncbi:TPA: hypothetical protein ACRZCD_004564, partial [Escherichia coli]
LNKLRGRQGKQRNITATHSRSGGCPCISDFTATELRIAMDKKIPHPGSDAGTLLSVRIYKLSRLSVSICLYHFVLQLLLDQESRSITEEMRYIKLG